MTTATPSTATPSTATPSAASPSSASPDAVVVIEVRFDAASDPPLTIEGETPQIEPGQCVAWRFHGLDDDPAATYYPAVYFPTEAGLTLGPFASLRQNGSEFWGTGHSGRDGEHPYLATVYRQQRGAAASEPYTPAQGTITSASSVADSSPLVRVKLKEGSDGYQADFEPERCAYFAGSTVLWEIEGLPEGAAAAIRFIEYEGQGEQFDPHFDLHFGPFESITWLEDKKALLGAGYNDALGRYHYELEILTVEDGVVVRHRVSLDETTDPVIDREGDPPPYEP